MKKEEHGRLEKLSLTISPQKSVGDVMDELYYQPALVGIGNFKKYSEFEVKMDILGYLLNFVFYLN